MRSAWCIKGVLWGVVLAPFMVLAQVTDVAPTENAIEAMADRSMDEAGHPEWIEDLSDLAEHPVNLNNTSLEELMTIPLITRRQAENILNYLMNYGQFLSVYELFTVSGFDSLTVSRILPYIDIGSGPENHPLKLKKIFTEGQGKFIASYQQVLQKQAGYEVPDSVLAADPDAGYAGSPSKLGFRFEYNYYDRLSIGLGGEKDAGEQFFRGEQKYGMDYYCGYIRIRNTGFLKDLVIGNFKADFGQGLVMGTGSAFGTAGGSTDLMRCPAGIRPSLSMNETSFLRGIAGRMKFGSTGISLFCSGPGSVTGTTGLVAGASINWKNRFMSAGFTGVYSRYDEPFNPDPEPYKLYAFTGRENLNLGFDFRIIANNIFFFGEAAGSLNGGIAWLAGLQLTPDPSSSVSVMYRDYQPSYQDLLSAATGRNTPNANERGFLAKAKINATKKLTVSGYADICSFPWLKYRTDFPSRGSEWIAEGELDAARNLIILLRFRAADRQINAAGEEGPLHSWINCRNYCIRAQVNWQVLPALTLRSRMEIAENHSEQKATGNGYVVFQDILYKPVRFPLSVYFRYALFDTDSWDERIYTYETDILYGYSVPALDGKGIRCFLMVSLKISRNISLSARYAQTWYSDRETIGSGLSEIEGDIKSEIKIQVKIRF